MAISLTWHRMPNATGGWQRLHGYSDGLHRRPRSTQAHQSVSLGSYSLETDVTTVRYDGFIRYERSRASRAAMEAGLVTRARAESETRNRHAPMTSWMLLTASPSSIE